jgi:DNA-binding NarL/FixJ family response regulator
VIRILVVADAGAVMASITQSLYRLPNVDIVAYASGRARLGAVVTAVRPDVVLIDEMRRSGRAAERIAEVRQALPEAGVVGLTDRLESPWVIDALRAGAATVVPFDLEAATLDAVLREVVEDRHGAPAVAASARRAAA